MTRTNFSYDQNLKSIKNELHSVKKKKQIVIYFCDDTDSDVAWGFFGGL